MNFLFFFLTISLGYLCFAGFAYGVFYVFQKSIWSSKKIQMSFPAKKNYSREVKYSLMASVIFAIFATGITHPTIEPHTKIYSNIAEFGFGYFGLSILLSFLIHDTYFYWMHRVMHTKWCMKHVHSIHHRSNNVSPWTAFSFHPGEAIAQAGVLILLVFVIPLHFWAVMIFLCLMTLHGVYEHLGLELLPKGFNKTWIGRWVNTSVCHNQHHEHFAGNYGLYFVFWDRLMGTLREDYDASYEEVVDRH